MHVKLLLNRRAEMFLKILNLLLNHLHQELVHYSALIFGRLAIFETNFFPLQWKTKLNISLLEYPLFCINYDLH